MNHASLVAFVAIYFVWHCYGMPHFVLSDSGVLQAFQRNSTDKLLWVFPCRSSLCVIGKCRRVFVASLFGAQVTALHPGTGEILWRLDLERCPGARILSMATNYDRWQLNVVVIHKPLINDTCSSVRDFTAYITADTGQITELVYAPPNMQIWGKPHVSHDVMYLSYGSITEPSIVIAAHANNGSLLWQDTSGW